MRGSESLGKTRTVSRILRQGGSHYCLIPVDVMSRLGLKHGDRIIMDTDGRIGYFAKLPIEELLKSPEVMRTVRKVRERVDAIDAEQGISSEVMTPNGRERSERRTA